MELQDGFIVGIHNYCDRWCEICAFTSRCHLFVFCAESEANDAPPLPRDVPPSPAWIQELIAEITAPAESISDAEYRKLHPETDPAHWVIEARADAYADRVHAWLDAHGGDASLDPGDPRAIIGWFQYSIAAKTHRALRGLADQVFDPEWPADYDGSAKVALLGIERSHAAWLELAQHGLASPAEIAPCIADLIWLGDELECVFPRARAFVRPGFDDPTEVAALPT